MSYIVEFPPLQINANVYGWPSYSELIILTAVELFLT